MSITGECRFCAKKLQGALVEAADLSEDEAARLACAFGEIGVGDAKTLLELLRDRTSPDHVAIHQEIQIALDAIARSAR